MSYFDAKQTLNMMLRNGQISEYDYSQELTALNYAYSEQQTKADDNRGVSS